MATRDRAQSNPDASPVKLTAKEAELIEAIAQASREHDAFAGDLTERGVQPMTELVCEQVGISRRSVSGVFASLVRKGLIWTDTDSPIYERSCQLTEAGVAALADLEQRSEGADPDENPGLARKLTV